MKRIPYGRQSIGLTDAFELAKGVFSPWLTLGPHVEKFESDLCKVARSENAIVVSSGSAALHCAYAAIDLGPGDEVITTPLTFASTATTAMNLGARVLFADIQPRTGNLDPRSIESLVSPRTKAITVVDYAGLPADLDKIMAIGKKYAVPVIEDAAHSLGSFYKGNPVGSLADITTFSFFPTKNITTGEGGAVVTNNLEFARKARLFRSHGVIKKKEDLMDSSQGAWFQEVQSLGLNYRMSDLLARLGSNQIRRIAKFRSQRAKVFAEYGRELASTHGVTLPHSDEDSKPMWHLYPVRVEPVDRRRIFDGLTAAGILVQVNYIPVNSHPYFRSIGYDPNSTPRAKEFYDGEISLPMFAGLRHADIKRICRELKVLVPNGNPGHPSNVF